MKRKFRGEKSNKNQIQRRTLSSAAFLVLVCRRQRDGTCFAGFNLRWFAADAREEGRGARRGRGGAGHRARSMADGAAMGRAPVTRPEAAIAARDTRIWGGGTSARGRCGDTRDKM